MRFLVQAEERIQFVRISASAINVIFMWGKGVSVRAAEEYSWVQNPTRNPKHNVDSGLQQLIMDYAPRDM